MTRAKDVKHIKGGKQKLSNMKSLVKQLIRSAGITNRYDLVLQNWPPRKMMDLYLGVRHLFAFTCLSSDKRRRYETILWKTISMRCRNRRANYLGSSDGISRAGGIGLVLQ